MNTTTTQARGPSETVMTREDQQNAGGMRRVMPDTKFVYYDAAPLTEYPRMMYKKTDKEITQAHADALSELKDAPMVINRYSGLLCDTMIAHDAAEAEALSANGWDISPQAAYGEEPGMVEATSAKDAEIAELRRQLAERAPPAPEPEIRRGPGRPPKTIE